MMRFFKGVLVATCLLAFHLASAGVVTTAAQQQVLTPQTALQRLIEGNQRFIREDLSSKNQSEIIRANAQGQHPYAFIFNCVDSRSVPEILFDEVPGNIFVGRVAGNVADQDMLGSMEFATKFAGSKLIVVMGHTSCGAVRGACTNVKAGNLTGLLAKIMPAVDTVKTVEKETFSCDDTSTIDAIARQNVFNQMDYILQNSSIIAELVKEEKVMIVGAMHDISTGSVVFFDRNGKTLN